MATKLNNTPHPHKDLIIAWANGAEIEVWDKRTSQWCLIAEPSGIGWWPSNTYRIKPRKIETRAYQIGDGGSVYFVHAVPGELETVNKFVEGGKATWVSDWFEVSITK